MALQGHCAPLFLADSKLLYPNACMHMQLVTTLWHSHEPQNQRRQQSLQADVFVVIPES